MSVRKWLGLALLPLLASACNSHDNTVSDLSLPDVAGGVRSIRLSGDAAGNDGVAFTAASGAAYWVLGDDSNAAATVIYRRDRANAAWRRVPAEHGAMTLVTQLDEALPLTALTLPASATTYRASLGGVVRTLTLSPEGVVDARQNGCVVSGQLGPAAITGALLVRLHLGGCGGDGDYSGVAYADPDAPNAAFRVVVDNGSSILDFFAFP